MLGLLATNLALVLAAGADPLAEDEGGATPRSLAPQGFPQQSRAHALLSGYSLNPPSAASGS